MSKNALHTIAEMIRRNSKHKDAEIVSMYKALVRRALLSSHNEVEVDNQVLFDALVKAGKILLTRDYLIDSWTVKNIRAKQEERIWKYCNDEMASIVICISRRANDFVIRFKILEFATTSLGALHVLEKRPCAWCIGKFDTTSEQLEHMQTSYDSGSTPM